MLSTNGGCIYGLAYKDQTTNVGELGIWVIELYIHSSIGRVSAYFRIIVPVDLDPFS